MYLKKFSLFTFKWQRLKSTNLTFFSDQVKHCVNMEHSKPLIEPQLQRAPRERIIPIVIEDDDEDMIPQVAPPSSVYPASSLPPRASASPAPTGPTRVTSFGMAPVSSTLGSPPPTPRPKTSPEPIK